MTDKSADREQRESRGDMAVASRRSYKVKQRGLAFEGWMEKLGGGAMKKWQPRFFSLRGDILYWYDDERAPTPQKYLQISRTVLVKGPKKEPKEDAPFLFSVTEPSVKKWYLKAKNKSEGAKWLKQLSSCGAKVTPDEYAVSDEVRQARQKKMLAHIEAMKDEGLSGARRRSVDNSGPGDEVDEEALKQLALKALKETRSSRAGTETAALEAVGGSVLSVKVPKIGKGKQIAWTNETTAGHVVEALIPWLQGKLGQDGISPDSVSMNTWALFFKGKQLDEDQLLKEIGLKFESEVIFKPIDE